MLSHFQLFISEVICRKSEMLRLVRTSAIALSLDTTRHYRGTARNFLSYLGADHPGVQCLDQLRREPHILVQEKPSFSTYHAKQIQGPSVQSSALRWIEGAASSHER